MMSVLHKEEGANLRIEILQEPGVQSFIESHAAALDHSMQSAQLSPVMRERLSKSNYVFSGIKTFHELNEAFPSLLDDNGNRKPFEQFLNDVQSIDKTYNGNYLRAEYNFVNASADMAAKWEQFQQDGDRYNLQYRTANDGKVRPEHAELHGVTLPPSDPFWSVYYPPNGWNCRCTVVQVRKSKYPTTDHTEAMERGEKALSRDKKGMFRFNPGIQGKSFPDYNPYTISRCRDCDIASKLAARIPTNELCAACSIVRAMCKSDAKRARHAAKPLQGSVISNDAFLHPVIISGRTIKEWTNQPFKYFQEKNEMLLDMKQVFHDAEYLGPAANHKQKESDKRVVQSHIFRIQMHNEDFFIIVREYDWGEYVLHSISDSRKMDDYVIKEKNS